MCVCVCALCACLCVLSVQLSVANLSFCLSVCVSALHHEQFQDLLGDNLADELKLSDDLQRVDYLLG